MVMLWSTERSGRMPARLAVGRHVADAVADGGARALHHQRLAIQLDLAARSSARRPKSVSTTSEQPLPISPASPSTSPARRSKDTSRTSLPEARSRHREDDLARVAGRALGVDQLAADHGRDHLLLGQLIPRFGEDALAIAQDRDAVGHAKDLAQFVRDIDHPDAPVGQRADQLQQPVDLGLAEGGRGLVHDHHLGIKSQGAGDLDQLLLGHRQIAHLGPGIQVDLEQLGHLFGAPVHGVPVDAQARASAPGSERCSRPR